MRPGGLIGGRLSNVPGDHPFSIYNDKNLQGERNVYCFCQRNSENNHGVTTPMNFLLSPDFFSPICSGNLKEWFSSPSALYGFKPFSGTVSTLRRGPRYQMRKKARCQHGFGGKARHRRAQRSDGGVQRPPRSCHAVRGTDDNHHPPAGHPPSRALQADLAHPGGEAGLTPGAKGQGTEWDQPAAAANPTCGPGLRGKNLLKPMKGGHNQFPTQRADRMSSYDSSALTAARRQEGALPLLLAPPWARPLLRWGGAPTPGRRSRLSRDGKTWVKKSGQKEGTGRSVNFIFSEKEKSKGKGNWIDKVDTASVDPNRKRVPNSCGNFLLLTSFRTHIPLLMFAVPTVNSIILWTDAPTFWTSRVCSASSLIET